MRVHLPWCRALSKRRSSSRRRSVRYLGLQGVEHFSNHRFVWQGGIVRRLGVKSSEIKLSTGRDSEMAGFRTRCVLRSFLSRSSSQEGIQESHLRTPCLHSLRVSLAVRSLYSETVCSQLTVFAKINFILQLLLGVRGRFEEGVCSRELSVCFHHPEKVLRRGAPYECLLCSPRMPIVVRLFCCRRPLNSQNTIAV